MIKSNHTQYLFMYFLVFICLLSPSSSKLFAFTSNKETRGPISFEFSDLEPITVEGKIYFFPFTVKNDSDTPLSINADFSSIETVFLYDNDQNKLNEKSFPESVKHTFVVNARSTYQGQIPFAVRAAFKDAHYPIRAKFNYKYNKENETIELRPVFTTKISEFLPTSRKLTVNKLLPKSYLSLSSPNFINYAPYWRKFDGAIMTLPIGWSGTEETSKCSYHPCNIARGGINRTSWSIHPPYMGGPGVIGLRCLVSLPNSSSINLRFFRAMRDVFAPEPATDGIIFRVYASPLCKNNNSFSEKSLTNLLNQEPRKQDIILNEQYAGTNWSEVNLDLSSFANQTILLTFEADPGIKRDTTCDNSFWGDVILVSDQQEVKLANTNEREKLRLQNEKDFLEFVNIPQDTSSSGLMLSSISRGFSLGDDQFAVVTLGNFGICDGWVTIGSQSQYVQIDGVRAKYQGVNVGYDRPLVPCNVTAEFVEKSNLEKYARIFAYQRSSDIIGDLPVDANISEKDFENVEILSDAPNDLTCYISRTDGGLAFRFIATHNEDIELLQFGPISQKAKRIYFGHGHCIEEPQKAFIQSGDGFGCSSSHVGFDFNNGLSLLQATTRPVVNLIINPELNIYTLTTAPDSRLTLRSSNKGAFDCAIKYAPGFDKSPAPLVSQKAGRFVFDYWGSSYANVLDRMKTFVRYGLTDSLLIQHVWQHYGYDVRLPDIWPPNPKQGTLKELKETQKFCDKHGIPFGLHDNYIDFYPDADSFNYNDIIMNPDGLPQKAWYNPGPDAQSYRFRPDAIFPYAERNLDIISKELMQTAYFTDVFSSIHIMNYYDVHGNFHSRAESLDCWNKYFDLVRKKFNSNAITISESGSDALIGHLEGADAILRRITPTQENFSTVIDCVDSEYVPWFDAVNHNRFILHGVGYSDRYQGGLSRALRGIESDDYLSSEVLTGHALMVDLGVSDRGTIRKYWLLQSLARELAMDEIIDFNFVENDIHRQLITWKSGTIVYVNRGKSDWTISNLQLPGTSEESITLPQFGFWTINMNNGSYGGVIRKNEQIIELRVDGDGKYFVNGRNKVSNQVTPIRATYEEVQILDSNSITGKMVWNAIQPTTKPYTPFLHLERPKTWWNDKPKLHVLPLPTPNKSSDNWQGREDQLFGETVTITVPQDLEAGYYNLLCGLYDRTTGSRLPLLGLGTQDTRYRLGSIIIEGNGSDRKLSFIPLSEFNDVDLRLSPNHNPSDFGVCSTIGAFKLEQKSEKTVLLTPLPDEPSFMVKLQTKFFKKGAFTIIERNHKGEEVSRRTLTAQDGTLVLEINSSQVFVYEIIKSQN